MRVLLDDLQQRHQKNDEEKPIMGNATTTEFFEQNFIEDFWQIF